MSASDIQSPEVTATITTGTPHSCHAGGEPSQCSSNWLLQGIVSPFSGRRGLPFFADSPLLQDF